MDMIHTVLHYKPCTYIGDCACIFSKPSWSALLQETALVLEKIRYVCIVSGAPIAYLHEQLLRVGIIRIEIRMMLEVTYTHKSHTDIGDAHNRQP